MLVPLKRGGKTGLLGGAGVSPNMVTVFGQMNEPPGSRFRVGHAALTMVEYFRDDEHRSESASRLSAIQRAEKVLTRSYSILSLASKC